jgi:hypothetical protein
MKLSRLFPSSLLTLVKPDNSDHKLKRGALLDVAKNFKFILRPSVECGKRRAKIQTLPPFGALHRRRSVDASPSMTSMKYVLP